MDWRAPWGGAAPPVLTVSPHSAFAPLFAHPIPALQAIGLLLHSYFSE